MKTPYHSIITFMSLLLFGTLLSGSPLHMFCQKSFKVYNYTQHTISTAPLGTEGQGPVSVSGNGASAIYYAKSNEATCSMSLKIGNKNSQRCVVNFYAVMRGQKAIEIAKQAAPAQEFVCKLSKHHNVNLYPTAASVQ